MAGPLATTTDVTERLGRPLTTEEQNRATAALADASAAIRAATRQQITRGDLTVNVTASAGTLTITQRPINSITSVHDTWGNTVAGVNRTGAVLWGPFTDGLTYTVALNAGYDTTNDPFDVLSAIAGLTAQVAIRTLLRGPDAVGTVSETIDTYSHTEHPDTIAGPWQLLPGELAAARRILGLPATGSVRVAVGNTGSPFDQPWRP